MDRKIIFLDIDGTLTDPGTNVPPQSALTAIRSAKKKGHYVFLCTGRNYEMLSPLLKYGFDGVVASSGGYIECNKQVIYDCPMTEDQRVRVLTTLEKNGVFRTVECMDGSYTDEGFKIFLKEKAQYDGNSDLLRWREQLEKSLNILPMEKYQQQPVYKVVIMCNDEKNLEAPKALLGDEFHFCVQGMDKHGIINGEIVNKKFDKGQAVKRVCAHLNIPVEDTFGFGDSMNDFEMLKTVGFSICMSNGSDELKKVADDICPSVREGGIYRSFIKYGLM